MAHFSGSHLFLIVHVYKTICNLVDENSGKFPPAVLGLKHLRGCKCYSYYTAGAWLEGVYSSHNTTNRWGFSTIFAQCD